MVFPQPDLLERIDVFSDVCVPVEVRVAMKTTTLSEILRLDVGDVISFDKPAGETLEIFVGTLLLASAEVIVHDDLLAVRVTDLNPPALNGSAGVGTTA